MTLQRLYLLTAMFLMVDPLALFQYWSDILLGRSHSLRTTRGLLVLELCLQVSLFNDSLHNWISGCCPVVRLCVASVQDRRLGCIGALNGMPHTSLLNAALLKQGSHGCLSLQLFHTLAVPLIR